VEYSASEVSRLGVQVCETNLQVLLVILYFRASLVPESAGPHYAVTVELRKRL
jgi:hypothetical protein